jgi:acetyl esterase
VTTQGPIPIRIYLPQVKDNCPIFVFFHGGGFVFGDLDTLECHCREIAYYSNCIVISVDYPLAPEQPFPNAPEAAYAATNWIYDHLSEWKGDENSLFIGGSSSGATLAAVVSIMIRDRGGPKLSGQVLLCPMTDADFNTPSYHENAVGYNLTREHCMWFLSKYSPDLKQRNNPLFAPLRSPNFKDLPSALIVTAEFDPLRDEGRSFAKKLQESGVACHDLCYQGMIHGFSTLPLELPEKFDVLNKINTFFNSD